MAREPARIYIERMKDAFKVRTDEELGGILGYSKQAIANWRRRDVIPRDISERMADAFGAHFATDDSQRAVLEIRESEVVYAVALFAYERYLNKIGRKITIIDRRALGYLFPSLVYAVHGALRNIGFEGENSLSMIELLTAMVERGSLKEVEDVIRRAPQ